MKLRTLTLLYSIATRFHSALEWLTQQANYVRVFFWTRCTTENLKVLNNRAVDNKSLYT